MREFHLSINNVCKNTKKIYKLLSFALFELQGLFVR